MRLIKDAALLRGGGGGGRIKQGTFKDGFFREGGLIRKGTY